MEVRPCSHDVQSDTLWWQNEEALRRDMKRVQLNAENVHGTTGSKAPLNILGNVKPNAAAQDLFVATTQLIPISLRLKGKTSAEYTNAHDRSLGE